MSAMVTPDGWKVEAIGMLDHEAEDWDTARRWTEYRVTYKGMTTSRTVGGPILTVADILRHMPAEAFARLVPAE